MSQSQSIPQLYLEGPYDSNDNKQGPETSLLVTDQSTEDVTTETEKEDIPGNDDESALLTPLQGERGLSYDGKINAFSALDNGYGSDRVSATQEYLFAIESLCLAEQGQGYKIVDALNGVSRSPTSDLPAALVEEAEWTLADDDNLNGKYRIEVTIAEGVTQAPTDVRTNYINDQSTSQIDLASQSGSGVSQSALEGEVNGTTELYSLGSIEEIKYTRSVDINAQEIIHNQDVPQVGAIESGVQGTFRISGTMTDSQTINAASLTDWVVVLNEQLHGQQLILYEEFTNRPFTGALSTSTSEFRDDKPVGAEYDIEFDVGTTSF